MREVDVLDEALINAPPNAVFRALIDQASGKAPWWLPDLEAEPRGTTQADRVGALTDVTVHRLGTPHFTARTVEAVPGQILRVQYVEGDIRGEGTWTLEPAGTQTLLRFRWRVRPHRWMFRLLAPFVDFGRMHSEVMQIGFVRLSQYLGQRQDPS
jgi:uncharacterized protein YndB with AHSA1/START domain